MSSRVDRLVFGLALLLGVLPLWVAGPLPLVDLPQHLHLISVLHRLDDPTTLFPQVFALRGQLTPYLGYYYAVSALSWVVPLEVANKLFLSAYVAGLPLALAYLLGALNRPRWPALLALPFAYGDSFAWGFINYCSALPLAFWSCGLLVRAVTAPRRSTAVTLALVLVAVLLFHVQVFVFLGLALPLLLVLTRGQSEGNLAGWLRARRGALLAVLPAVLLFAVWVGARLGQPSEVEYGAPWKAWGPLLSAQNLSFKRPAQNWAELPTVLANQLRDGSDRLGLLAVLAVALAAALARWLPEDIAGSAREKGSAAILLAVGAGTFALSSEWGAPQALSRAAPWGVGVLLALALVPAKEGSDGGLRHHLRLPLLAALAVGLYLALPFDIRGYMYYLNTRYAHLAAPLLLAGLPPVSARRQRPLLWLAGLSALCVAAPLSRGFQAFAAEAAPLSRISVAAAPKPRVMGLIFQPQSRVVTHPAYLHAATQVARENGGLTNFSFALTPHSPLKYQGAPPPTFPSEWRPDQFSWAQQGAAYDHFLLRGVSPAQVFGDRVGSQLDVVAHEGDFWLLRRR